MPLKTPHNSHDQDPGNAIQMIHFLHPLCVRVTCQVKKGPLAETSPIIYDVSTVPTWAKVSISCSCLQTLGFRVFSTNFGPHLGLPSTIIEQGKLRPLFYTSANSSSLERLGLFQPCKFFPLQGFGAIFHG